MSEMNENLKTEDGKASILPEKNKPMFDEYGQIAGSDGTAHSQESMPVVDPDDLPENQGMTPAINLARLKAQLDDAPEVDIDALLNNRNGSDSSSK